MGDIKQSWLGRATCAFAVAAFLLFLGLGTSALAQKPLDDDLWGDIKDTTNVGFLEGFIDNFPDSKHTPAARARVSALKQPVRPAGTATAPAPVVAADTQNFAEPRQNSQGAAVHVDLCLTWGRECGQPAADAFCRTRGFTRARSFGRKVTGGPNWVAEDAQICRRAECTALVNVACEGRREPGLRLAEMIGSPRLNNLPVALCLKSSGACGQDTADTYCRAAGWGRATSFRDSAPGTRSIDLGDGTICEGPQCRALTNVVCSR